MVLKTYSMKGFLVFFCLCIFCIVVKAQEKQFTKNGKISFYSKAPLEDIEGRNKSVTCVLDTKTGNLQFSVMMKGFEFRKALMQQHFNENYVESDKYPKAEFKGAVINNRDIDYAKEGTYPAKVKGKLTLHGETKEVNAEGTIQVANGRIIASTDFTLLLSDYKIAIPGIVKDKISNMVKIKVDLSMKPLKG